MKTAIKTFGLSQSESMHRLDNIIWKALTTRQAHLAETSGTARRFVRDVSPLAAFEQSGDDGYSSLASLVGEGETLGVFLNDAYEPRSGWDFVVGAPLLQMICENGANASASSGRTNIVELGDKDSPEMLELTALTKPGPFGTRTHQLGYYVGIRYGGKLVAMAGERLKVPGHTEISAVCTHPDHLGKGYARVLMQEVMRAIRGRGETPFLHVRADNARAIALYERLGFNIRWSGHFAVLRKVESGF
jgi:predicted GNAT family acetyltransferase